MTDPKRKHGRRILALILILILVMPENLFLSFATESYEDSLDGWKVDCYWSDVSYDYVWDSYSDESRRPRLIFTYRLENAGHDYAPGSIKVEIPGIGYASRACIEPAASLPTDSEDSEWEVLWDQNLDIYTFTNIFEVKEGESVNGGFEILWELRSRDIIDGYEQKRSPAFGVSDEGVITLRSLGFSFNSARDRYRLVSERNTLSAALAGFADDEHVWYEINTSFNKVWLARGLECSTCTVNIDIPDCMSADDIVVLSGQGEEIEVTEKSRNELEFFLFRDRKGNLGSRSYVYSQNFIIGFDMEKADDQEIIVREHLDRLYQDESEWLREGLEGEMVDTELSFTLQSYDFGWQGLLYDHDLWNEKYENFNKPPAYYWYGSGDEESHLEPPEYAQRLCASDIYNGTVVEFTLRGCAEKDYGPADSLRIMASPSDMIFFDASPSDMEYIILSDTGAEGADNSSPCTYGDSVDDPETLWRQDIIKDPQIASPSVLMMGESEGYSMVIGDDELAIVLQNGSIRPLSAEEYDLAYMVIPAHEGAYGYEIYGAASNDLPFERYRLLETSDMSASRMFSLPRGIKAAFVRINGITGNFEVQIRLGVQFKLDKLNEQGKPADIQCDHENRIIDFSYLRVLHRDAQNVERNDCIVSAGDYGGSYGGELAARDLDLYHEFLLRDYSNVWLRSTAMTLKAGVSLAPFESNMKDAYLSRVVANGTITADEPGELTRFSLYAILPEGLRFDLYSELMTVAGSLTAADGGVIDDPSGYVSFSEGRYNGRKMLQADFDFRSRPLAADASNWVRIYFPVSLSFADAPLCRESVSVTTYLLVHDEGIDRIIGPAITSDEYDIDKNGITTEKMAYASAERSIRENADEWREFVYKSVKSEYSDGYVTETAVTRDCRDEGAREDEGSLYEYRLSFGLGSSAASDIIFFDHLESGAGQNPYGSDKYPERLTSEWQGVFCSVDTEYAKDNGFIPTVYYSVNADEPFDLSSPGWSRRLPQDKSAVRSIAVKLDTSNLSSGLMKAADMTYVTVKMRAPSDGTLTGRKAVNQFCVSYSSYGANGGYEDEVILPSAATIVTLLESVGRIILQKADADSIINVDADGKKHYASLTGAEFTILDQDGKALYESPKGTDSLGRLVIENVTQGLYYWEETKAPEGYEAIPGKHPVMIDGVNDVITIENHRLPASVTLTKHDQDDKNAPALAGAVFELSLSSGEKIFTDASYNYDEEGKNGTFITGEDGSLTITGLPWGSYVFEEIKAPKGYELMSIPITFNVDKNSYDARSRSIHTFVDAYDNEKTASLCLTKTDAVSGEAVAGAVYSLYRTENGEDILIASGLKSGTDGRIEIDGLKFGTYYFLETLNPGGYLLPQDESAKTQTVTLNAGTAGALLEISHTDERKSGSVTLDKRDDTGRLIPGAVFDLYSVSEDGGEQLLGSYVTGDDEYGAEHSGIYVDGLEWGEYYFIETKVPEGYQLSQEKIFFTIDRQSVQNTIELTAVNERARGSILIKKTDRNDNSKTLAGASFALYSASGDPCIAGKDYQLPEGSDSITTGADGTIILTGLEQGAYYLKEISAPDTYSLNGELIRFSITMENASLLQELTVEDNREGAVLIIDKEVDDVYEAFGNPTFLFKITRSDGEVYYTSLNLTPQITSDSVRLNVEQGFTYTVEEVGISRYLPDRAEGIKNAVAEGDKFTVIADLTTDKEAEVKFYNRLEQYEKFSHTSGIVNSIKKSSQLTAVTAVYLGPDPITRDLPGFDAVEERYSIPDGDLCVTAYFDDGMSVPVPARDYILNPAYADGNSNSYTGTVTVEKNGVRRSDSFSVAIDLPVPSPKSLVTFELNGGMIIPEGEMSAKDSLEIRVLCGSRLNRPGNDPVRENYSFTGWFLDKDLRQEAAFPLTVKNDMTIYAGWSPLPIEVRYAVSIYDIGADKDGDGNVSGLTFGPALGASWLNSYRSHTPSEGQLCIHSMSWDEIIEISAKNPEVFRECLKNGCTHALDLSIKNALAEGADPPGHFLGDGVSVLSQSINESYRRFNYPDETDENDTSSYAGSDIRKILNGQDAEPGCSLISTLPRELISAVMKKEMVIKTADGSAGTDEKCQDSIWLFSLNELFPDSPACEGKLYERQKILGAGPSDLAGYAEDGRSHGFWLRSSSSGTRAYMTTPDGTYEDADKNDPCGIAFGFSLPGPKPTAKAAVSLYGICQDLYREEDGTQGVAGLSFGPALGADYRKTYVSHMPYGDSAGGNAHRCIHDDDWETIAAFSLKDPYVYEQCLGDADTPGCTKGLDLFLEGPLCNGTFNFSGDGPGILLASLPAERRSWCYDCTYKDGPVNDGGWPASYIRAVLNGADEFTNRLCDGSPALTSDSKKPVAGDDPPKEEESLFNCLPPILKENIVPKMVVSDTLYNDVTTSTHTVTTFDRLWLLSTAEFYPAGSSYEVRPNEGKQYARFAAAGIEGNSADEKMIPFGENSTGYLFLRTISEETRSTHKAVNRRGGLEQNQVDTSNCGIGFGFCLK